ncbi:MAG: secretin N-terminal domain-containing protein, partial [Pirellulaceae bacterium]
RVVQNILIHMDEAGIRQRELKVFRLKNTSAEAVAAALQDFLAQQQSLQQSQGQLISALERLEEQVIMVADPVTNSLIVSATARYMPQVEKMIEDLDRRNPMVVIQLMIVEVTLSDLDEFGVELGLQDSLLFQRGTPIPGFNFNNQPLGNTTAGVNTENTAGQGLTSFGVGRTSAAGGVGGLVLSASSESVSLLIRALQSSQRAQILSRPQIQTMDNQPAFVQVGARVPRVQGQTVTNNNVTQNVQDENVGILLGVTPRVTPDGMVVMEIDAEKSEVGPDATGIVIGTDSFGNAIISPQILTNLAQTTITARSGQTVILGGLISHATGETTRRVPYLGDVPVLGRLFRFDSVSVERKEVLFILTPYIMDPKTPEVESNYNFRETERLNWCLADVVNVHGALPVGTAGVNALSHESPLIFPDETPAGPSVLTPEMPLDPR